MTKSVVFDIDGTLLINDLPDPDWDNPHAIHPVTRERICGHMPVYWSHNQLNPQLRPDDLREITVICTGRPQFRKQMTLTELNNHGITPYRIMMYPEKQQYTREKSIYWKALCLNVSLDADYYVDNDPILKTQLSPLLTKCKILTVEEWQQLLDRGDLEC